VLSLNLLLMIILFQVSIFELYSEPLLAKINTSHSSACKCARHTWQEVSRELLGGTAHGALQLDKVRIACVSVSP
jgi:hypothetical protein